MVPKLKYAIGNAASTTLATGITNTDTAAPLTADTNFASKSGEGMVLFDEGADTEELAYSTTKSGGALTVPLVNRGIEGGTAQGHTSGSSVRGVLSAGMWNDLIDTMLNFFDQDTGDLDTTKVVDPDSAQEVENKTLINPIIAKILGATSGAQFPQVAGEFDNGNSGTSITIDWSKGDRQLLTLTGNCTISYSNRIKGQTVTLRIVEDGTGGRTVTLPTSKWANGSPGSFTTTASAINLLVVYYDGTNNLTQLSAGFA